MVWFTPVAVILSPTSFLKVVVIVPLSTINVEKVTVPLSGTTSLATTENSPVVLALPYKISSTSPGEAVNVPASATVKAGAPFMLYL